jgi:hypothetical protein
MQQPPVRRALLETVGLQLTHELVDGTGKPVPDSVTLPATVFCAIWTRAPTGGPGRRRGEARPRTHLIRNQVAVLPGQYRTQNVRFVVEDDAGEIIKSG